MMENEETSDWVSCKRPKRALYFWLTVLGHEGMYVFVSRRDQPDQILRQSMTNVSYPLLTHIPF
jgi:hypothetical protein